MHISIIHGNQYALHCEYFPLVPHYYEKSIDGSEINCKKKKQKQKKQHLSLSKMICSSVKLKTI